EGRFATYRFGLAKSDDGPFVAPVRGFVHPCTVRLAEMFDQYHAIGICKLTDGAYADRVETCGCFGSDSVYLAHRQWPDAGGNIGFRKDRHAAGLVQVRSDFRK